MFYETACKQTQLCVLFTEASPTTRSCFGPADSPAVMHGGSVHGRQKLLESAQRRGRMRARDSDLIRARPAWTAAAARPA